MKLNVWYQRFFLTSICKKEPAKVFMIRGKNDYFDWTKFLNSCNLPTNEGGWNREYQTFGLKCKSHLKRNFVPVFFGNFDKVRNFKVRKRCFQSLKFDIQSNSVITNNLGTAILVRYNRLNLCIKMTNLL